MIDGWFLVNLFFSAEPSSVGEANGENRTRKEIFRQYAEFVIANTQFIKCSVFFVAPALMAIFVQDDSVAAQWHAIFYCTAGSLILVRRSSLFTPFSGLQANILFCVYATDKPQPFTFITEKKKEDEQA